MYVTYILCLLQGDEIHVVCKQDQLKSWTVDLMENCTYVMHNFKVMKNDGTVVRQFDLEDLPFKKYKFVEFTNFIAGHFQPELLVDIIGVVDEVVFRHVGSKSTRLLEYLNEAENDVPIIIILTHARIKEVQGIASCQIYQFLCLLNNILCVLFVTNARSYPPLVSNSLKASKLLINEPVFEIQEFNERLSDLGIKVRGVHDFQVQVNCRQKMHFFENLRQRPFLRLTTFLRKLFVLLSAPLIELLWITIHGVIQLTFSATKKTDVETVAFTCACGKYNDQPVLRYRLEVMVNYKEKNTKFLLWDRECTELIGQSANEVNRLEIAEGDVDLNVSPQALDKLLGYALHLNSKFNQSLTIYSNDLDLINVVVDMLPDVEACSKLHLPILDSNDPSQLESQSVSITADHDPLLDLPLTPTKRMTFDECDDEPKSSQISPAQIQYPVNKKPLIMQFTSPFHNDRDTIEVPSFYHEQWAPESLDFVRFRYDGTTYQIRLRQHRALDLRKATTNLRRRLPNCAITHLNACGQHMTILRRFGPPLQWNLVALDIGIGHKYVVQPWYQFLAVEISPTTMRSPSITGVGKKYGK
ncbi:hypothetical protein HKD37_07G019256 [Glycine soja]